MFITQFCTRLVLWSFGKEPSIRLFSSHVRIYMVKYDMIRGKESLPGVMKEKPNLMLINMLLRGGSKDRPSILYMVENLFVLLPLE